MLTESVLACRHTYKADSSPSPLPLFLPLFFFFIYKPPCLCHSLFHLFCCCFFFPSSVNNWNLCFSSSSIPFMIVLLFPFSMTLPLPYLFSTPPPLTPPPAPQSSLPPIAATVWSWMWGLGHDWSFRVECSGVSLFFIGIFDLIHCAFWVWESMLCLSVIGRWPHKRSVCVCVCALF